MMDTDEWIVAVKENKEKEKKIIYIYIVKSTR